MKKTLPISLIIAILLLLAGGALYGAETYLLRTIEKKNIALETKLAEMKQEAHKLASLKNAAASLDASEATVRSHELKKNEIVAYLSSVEAFGKSLGTGIQVVSVAEQPNATHPRAVVSLLVTGSFDSIMRTVGTLENSSYDTTLGGLTLSSTEGKGWSAATVLSVALSPESVAAPKKP